MLVLGPLQLPPHPVFEALSYTVGFQFYLWRRRRSVDTLNSDARLWVIAAAIAGAAIGSKVLCWFVDPALTLAHLEPVFLIFGGKTIVGGLAGGLLGVELAKKWLGITSSTGDGFAVPLCLGIAIGRIGCFLTGMSDRTYGTATQLPWAVDFGDGIGRHPTQLYEMLFLLALGAFIIWRSRRPYKEGALFRLFMVGYMGLRLVIEFIKPGIPLGGLTAIQWTCLAVLIYYGLTALKASQAATSALEQPLTRSPTSSVATSPE
jgi:phosphatidylglycerol:prolipoprotein diacylglycerol transferase